MVGLELELRDGRHLTVWMLCRLPRRLHIGWLERLVSAVSPVVFVTSGDDTWVGWQS